MSLLEQHTTRKGREFSVPEFELDDNKEYEVEAIQDNADYTKEVDGHLPRLYYLVVWKGYPEEKNTWEPSSAVMHLRKMVSTFHKDHPEKPTATSAPPDFAPPMAKQDPAPQTKARATDRTRYKAHQNALKRAPSEATRKRRQGRGNKEESKSVWF